MMMPGAMTAARRTAVGDEYSSGFTCRPPPRRQPCLHDCETQC
jgi:hypothetical protein